MILTLLILVMSLPPIDCDPLFRNIGSSHLYDLKVSGVPEVVAKHSSEAGGVAGKGVRASLSLDGSGLINVTSVEAAFERTVSVEEQGRGGGGFI